MNKKEQLMRTMENHRKYHTPGMPNYAKRTKNAIFISPSNSLEHERAKLEVCYTLRKLKRDFITEACRNSKENIRVDVVDLTTGDEIEIVHKNRKPKTLERYKQEGVIIIYTDKPIEEQLSI